MNRDDSGSLESTKWLTTGIGHRGCSQASPQKPQQLVQMWLLLEVRGQAGPGRFCSPQSLRGEYLRGLQLKGRQRTATPGDTVSPSSPSQASSLNVLIRDVTPFVPQIRGVQRRSPSLNLIPKRTRAIFLPSVSSVSQAQGRDDYSGRYGWLEVLRIKWSVGDTRNWIYL